MHQHPIFVGGSRNGTTVEDQTDRRSFTFVDGYLVEPGDGTLTVPINATIELYVLDQVEREDGESVEAYFLVDLDDTQRRERIASLMAA
ncbi:MAG: hypothetical protein EOP87_11325 [Verrucomicrobiaceae bacterium]|nr:MAG: hypothetical protein EOP87_11325 [Verrucomicrobiaceae bacterium]